MNGIFREVSFQRTEKVLKFLSEDDLINSDAFTILAIGSWHGSRWQCKTAAKQYGFTLLRYHRFRPGLKYFWLYFLLCFTADKFFIRLNRPRSLHDVHRSLMEFSNISYYVIPKEEEKNFTADVMRSHSEKMRHCADCFLQEKSIPYLVYRVDTDAPFESGFGEEYSYSEQTPAHWLKYS